MFAFALYDSLERTLLLARDRTGIKPLYYYPGAEGLYFGSELKALLTVPDVPRRLDYAALRDFVTLGYTVPPKTFFADVFQLPPGTWMEASRSGITRGTYWRWQQTGRVHSEREAVDLSLQAIAASVREHLISDVPIGAFLSGGIDSCLLVAILTKELGQKIDTFTVRFSEAAYDESPYARLVAERLGASHHEISVGSGTPDLSFVNEILDHFDEPFGDSSAIPTYLIAREIRKHVKVAIGGDGGDEMFGGYARFRYADLARRAGAALTLVPPSVLRSVRMLMRRLGPVAPDALRQAARFLEAASNRDERRLLALSCYNYERELPNVLRPDAFRAVGRNGAGSPEPGTDDWLNPGGSEFIDWTVGHALPGDYLRKVDMMSGAHGLEVRLPLLGNQVIDCAASIESRLKYKGKRNKVILRELVGKYLPASVAQKPKSGFGIPLDTWLGPLGREEVGAVLTSPGAAIRALLRDDYIRPLVSSFVGQKWDRAVISRYSLYQNVYMLWALERWLQKWNPGF
jgi:asparagine synthase (glutamine-hydrolysing)